MKKNAVKSPYTDEFNTIRVAVMVEEVPMSDCYHQFMLSREDNARLLKFLESMCEHKGDAFAVPVNEEVTYKIPDVHPYFDESDIDGV